MRFFLARDENAQTPLELQDLLDMLRAHSITRGELIRDDLSKDWVAIEKHAAFAKLLRGSPSAPPARTQTQVTSPWQIVTAVAAVLSVGGVGALVYLQVRTHDALLTRIDNVARHIDGVLTEVRDANALAPFVPLSQVHNNCITDRTTVTCTFTNLQDKPVSTCTQGIVKQKESPGVHLSSTILCTGKLYPSESKPHRALDRRIR